MAFAREPSVGWTSLCCARKAHRWHLEFVPAAMLPDQPGSGFGAQLVADAEKRVRKIGARIRWSRHQVLEAGSVFTGFQRQHRLGANSHLVAKRHP